jgi:ATP-binding cassette subfamily F protein uup
MDNVCGGQEFIDIGGRRRHAISYLGDFLFSADRVRSPVKALSGGEQNRAVLARLFSRPANLLVLDEPTNDLDIETLELLEDILLKFDGTVLLVSHDREFMDNVVTSLVVLDGHGGVSEHVGGFSDWEAAGGSLHEMGTAAQPEPVAQALPAPVAQPAAKAARKRSYKEQRELEQLPVLIEQLEQQQARLAEAISQPGFYQCGAAEVERVTAELAQAQQQLEAAFARWDELEAGA